MTNLYHNSARAVKPPSTWVPIGDLVKRIVEGGMPK